MAYGDIGGLIATYEFDTDGATNCQIIHIDGGVYAIAYCDAGSQCHLQTLQIPTNGQLSDPYIDDLVVSVRDGIAPCIQWVAGNIYIIASRDAQFRNTMTTVEIATNGQITDTIKDFFNWATLSNTWHSWARRSNTIVALAFQGDSLHGFLYSIAIDAAGLIDKTPEDTLEFDTVLAQPGHILQVNAGVFALPYHGPNGHGWIKTFTLGPLGELPSLPIPELEFDTERAVVPWLTRVHEGIYAIPYQFTANHGKLCTLAITSGGVITATGFDPIEFDDTYCTKATSVHCGGNILAIAYTGPDLDGWLKTAQIAANGQITAPPLPSFEFDEGNGLEPSIIRIAGNVYAIAYTGADNDGFLKTVSIESPIEQPPDHSLMIGIGP